MLKQTEELAELDGSLTGIEGRLWRIFLGACALNVVIAIMLVVSLSRIANARELRFPLVSLLAWSIIVTVYAFYSLHVFAQQIKGKLAQGAFVDMLTEVLNFRYLERRLVTEEERVKRYGGATAILYMDLDHFKKVNDTYGHHVGNVVLKEIAQVLAGQMRACDALARAGGDEFVAVMPETNHDQARITAERLKESVADYSLDLGQKGKIDFVRVSIGVAVYPGDGETMDAVVSAADRSIYKAKQRGGDAVWLKGDTRTPEMEGVDPTTPVPGEPEA